jgi:N-methylhydantoinase A
MGSWPAISPVSPGVLCALGDATTRMRTETARSFSRLADDTDEAELIALLGEMAAQTQGELRADGIAEADITSLFEIDLRYQGQAFEVPMTIDAGTLRRDGIAGLVARFDEEHRRLFTFNMASAHEIVNLRAIALGPALDLEAAPLPQGDGNPAAARLRDHELWIDGAMRQAAIYERSRLRTGDVVPGPAIVVEMDSTTLIEPDCVAVVDAVGNILINPA